MVKMLNNPYAQHGCALCFTACRTECIHQLPPISGICPRTGRHADVCTDPANHYECPELAESWTREGAP